MVSEQYSEHRPCIVRFAPSPTGNLHVGGARTAVFNYVFALITNGRLQIRIEDTDSSRCQPAYTENILQSLRWLGIKFEDCSAVWMQSSRRERHLAIAHELIRNDKAYYCTCSKSLIDAKREKAQAGKIPYRYDRICRNANHQHGVIRIKAPHNLVASDPEISSIDDYVIVRGDDSPVYLLSSVVDDHDMNVTHIIRGQDHLTNTSRQHIIWNAMGWKEPEYIHLGLVHGQDGGKLSKRLGSFSILDLRQQGYLPDAVFQYLLTLGWLPSELDSMMPGMTIDIVKNKEINVRPSRFDIQILNKINRGHMRMGSTKLIEMINDRLPFDRKQIEDLIDDAISRATTVNEVIDVINYCLAGHENHCCQKSCADVCRNVAETLIAVDDWTEDSIRHHIHSHAEEKEITFKILCGYLRSHVTALHNSLSIFKIMRVLSKSETLRILNSCNPR